MILGADIRICSEDARFAFPEVQVGIAGVTGAMLLSRHISWSAASHMTLTGDYVDAETALAWGLVSRVVPNDSLHDEAMQLADRIAQNAPLAVRATKEVMHRTRGVSFAEAYGLAEYVRQAIRETDDSREGPLAFSEKRPPQFRGR
jgi:enoyl-CoA hydratase/carnithine racemase